MVPKGPFSRRQRDSLEIDSISHPSLCYVSCQITQRTVRQAHKRYGRIYVEQWVQQEEDILGVMEAAL